MKTNQNKSAKADPIQSKIDRFLGLIAQGLKCFGQAGKLLVEMEEENPDIFELILKQTQDLTEGQLWSFYYTGKGRPVELLYSDAPGAVKLRSLPPATQAKIPMTVPIVETTERGTFRTVEKPLTEITRAEAIRAITADGIASPYLQKQAIQAEQDFAAEVKKRFKEDAIGVKFYQGVFVTWDEIFQIAYRGLTQVKTTSVNPAIAAAIKAAIQKNQVRG